MPFNRFQHFNDESLEELENYARNLREGVRNNLQQQQQSQIEQRQQQSQIEQQQSQIKQQPQQQDDYDELLRYSNNLK